MTAAYHPTAAELDQIRRNSGCAAPVAEFAFGPVFCGQPAVTVWVWEHDMRATDLFPLCGEHLIHLLGSHADGHRCTCIMTSPGIPWASPPEWEQDPWCPTHPDVDYIRAERDALAAQIADMVPKTWDGLRALLDEVYPDDIFPTLPDSAARAYGPRNVSLVRQLDGATTERDEARERFDHLTPGSLGFLSETE